MTSAPLAPNVMPLHPPAVGASVVIDGPVRIGRATRVLCHGVLNLATKIGEESTSVMRSNEAATGIEPVNGGFADLSLNHLGTPPYQATDVKGHGTLTYLVTPHFATPATDGIPVSLPPTFGQDGSRPKEAGFILIVVVWVIMVLTVVAIDLARTMRVEGLTTDVYQQEAQTYYLALAGLNEATYRIIRAARSGRTPRDQTDLGAGLQTSRDEEQPDAGDIWARGDGQWQKMGLGPGGYWVRVLDEGGKINLNQATEISLRQTFTNLGFEAEFTDELTDAILDWRDPDDLERLHGADSEYYLGLPIPYPAKNGPFDTVDELLLIRGVSRELFYDTLRSLFTVYGADSATGGGTNLLTASPVVLQAALGIDAETANSLVEERETTGAMDLANFMAEDTSAQSLNSLPRIVTIESVGYLDSGRTRRAVSAVVERTATDRFQTLYWKERPAGIRPPAAGPSTPAVGDGRLP